MTWKEHTFLLLEFCLKKDWTAIFGGPPCSPQHSSKGLRMDRADKTFHAHSLPDTGVILFACSASFLRPFPPLFCSFSFHLFSVSLSERVSVKLEPPPQVRPGSRARAPLALTGQAAVVMNICRAPGRGGSSLVEGLGEE